MPTIYRKAGWRFHFYAGDHPPPHVHVEKDGAAARFDLDPVKLTRNDGVRARDLEWLQSVVEAMASDFERAWYGFFGPNGPSR